MGSLVIDPEPNSKAEQCTNPQRERETESSAPTNGAALPLPAAIPIKTFSFHFIHPPNYTNLSYSFTHSPIIPSKDLTLNPNIHSFWYTSGSLSFLLSLSLRIKGDTQIMDVGQMQRQLVEYTKSLFIEGYLDSQFLQLQQLQDESNPSFVAEVVSLFFEDSERILKDLTFALEQKIIDFKKVDAHVHQFKGSSSSIGAQRVKNACIAFRGYCEEQNVNSCTRCLQQVKQEYFIVKNKLETLFRLEHQIIGAGGSIPMVELGF